MTFLLAIFFACIATLYAAVGGGGGSGYLAVMALMNLPPEVMKPTALTLNILVASIGTWKYVRAGHFSARLFWPIAAASIPCAFLGGRVNLPAAIYQPLVGLVLLWAAFRLWWSTRKTAPSPRRVDLPPWGAVLLGAGIGLLAGLLGIGGGIFLGPLLLLAGWADTRQALGLTAAFVLVNSAFGLLGYLSGVATLPTGVLVWLAAVGAGGWIGAEYGSRRFNPLVLRQLLALVLAFGGARMIVG